LNATGTYEGNVTTALTTTGVVGWTTGSYQFDLYAFVYRKFFCDDGKITIKE